MPQISGSSIIAATLAAHIPVCGLIGRSTRQTLGRLEQLGLPSVAVHARDHSCATRALSMARIHNIITLASSSRAVALNNGDQGYASTALATTASTDSRSCANKAVETIERKRTMVKRDFRVSDMDARKTLWALSQPKLEEGNEQIGWHLNGP